MQALAALLLCASFLEAGSVAVPEASFTTVEVACMAAAGSPTSESTDYGFMVLLAVVFTAVGVKLGMFFARLGKPKAKVKRVVTHAAVQTEPPMIAEKASQGPCTYTRMRATPRFQPLPEAAWG